MARLAVPERPIEKKDSRDEFSELSAKEKERLRKKAEYMRLLYADDNDTSDTAVSAQTAPAIRREEQAEKQTHTAPSAPVAYGAAPAAYGAEKVLERPSYAPQKKKELFSGISYQNGELVTEAPATAEPKAEVAAPAVKPKQRYAPVPETIGYDEEDALPTRRTMDTLHQPVVQAQSAPKTGLFSAVSTRAKVVLAAIVCAVVLAIVLICVNTGIINSLDLRISDLRTQVTEQKQIYEDLEQQIGDIENFEGSIVDQVTEYAEANGMVRAD